jgi:hypothetical protein
VAKLLVFPNKLPSGPSARLDAELASCRRLLSIESRPAAIPRDPQAVDREPQGRRYPSSGGAIPQPWRYKNDMSCRANGDLERERVALSAATIRFMPWFEVLIPNTDVADLDEAGFMNRLGVAILRSDVPNTIQVFRGRTDRMDWVFYIEIPGGYVPHEIAEVLQLFSGEPCDSPKTDYVTKLQVP